MKKFFRVFSFIVLFFIIILEGFAIDAPTNLKIESSIDDSVILKWDNTEGASVYDIYYGDSNGSENDISTIDLIETNTITVEGLEIGKEYYFRVVAYNESGETSELSEEVLYKIQDNNNEGTLIVNDFIFKTINVIAYNKLELEFSENLDNSENANREFKIENTEDMFDSFNVLETKLNEKDDSKLEITLDRDLKIGKEYEVIIIAITSSEGKNIESGIDNSETIFVEEIEIVEEKLELNSAGTDEITSSTSLIGKNIDISEIENTTLGAAGEQDNLPQTGPEHILMLILSIILGLLLFMFKFKKS